MSAESVHRFRYSYVVFLLALLSLYWLNLNGTVLDWMVTSTFIGALTLSVLFHSKHKHCAKCVMIVGLDGNAAAQARMPWLKDFHSWKLKAYPCAGLVLWIGGMILHNGDSVISPGDILMTLGCPFLIRTEVALNNHFLVYPWCPFCRRDDGDDEEEFDPDPVDDNEKSFPR